MSVLFSLKSNRAVVPKFCETEAIETTKKTIKKRNASDMSNQAYFEA
jgi:hypothetical protein